MLLWVLMLLLGGRAAAADAPSPSVDARLALALELLDRGRTELACTQLARIVAEPLSDEEQRRALRLAGILHRREPALCGFAAGADPQAAPSLRGGPLDLAVTEALMISASAAYVALFTQGSPVPRALLFSAAITAPIVRRIAQNRKVNLGQSMTISGTQLLAVGVGASFGWAIDRFGADRAQEASVGVGIGAGFVVGTVGGIILASKLPDVRPGDVALVRLTTTWGLAAGLSFRDLEGYVSEDRTVAFSLVGGASGLATGLLLTTADGLHPSRSMVNGLGVSAWVGGSIGAYIARDGPMGVGVLVGSVSAPAVVGLVYYLLREQPLGQWSASRTPASLAPALLSDASEGRVYPGVSVSGAW